MPMKKKRNYNVLSVNDLKPSLSKTISLFRNNPHSLVVFGMTNQKPEAVIISLEQYETLVDTAISNEKAFREEAARIIEGTDPEEYVDMDLDELLSSFDKNARS